MVAQQPGRVRGEETSNILEQKQQSLSGDSSIRQRILLAQQEYALGGPTAFFKYTIQRIRAIRTLTYATLRNMEEQNPLFVEEMVIQGAMPSTSTIVVSSSKCQFYSQVTNYSKLFQIPWPFLYHPPKQSLRMLNTPVGAIYPPISAFARPPGHLLVDDDATLGGEGPLLGGPGDRQNDLRSARELIAVATPGKRTNEEKRHGPGKRFKCPVH